MTSYIQTNTNTNIQIKKHTNKPQKRKMASCINLQGFIPGKQIFSLVFDKSIRNLLNSV